MIYSKRFTRRSFLVGSSTALLLAACGAPTAAPAGDAAAPAGAAAPPSDAAAAPASGVKGEVARKDTLVHYGGDTEILEPTNFGS